MTLLIIYIIGYIIAYFGQKKFVHGESTWTKKDRALALCLSSLSWIGIVVTIGAYFVERGTSDSPAKW